MAAIILKPIIPNLKKKPWIYDIRKSTFVLKNIKLDKSYQEKLRNLIHISERNLGLQNISFFSHYNYNSAFFKKGNPFFFVRKNYNKLFSYLLHRSFLSPNLLKFLRTAYWPSNANKAWRPFYIYHDLELKQRINDIKPKIKKFTYFFSLIFKKNYIQKLFNFKSQMQPSFVNKYFKKLKFFNRLIGNKFKYQEALDIKTSKKKKTNKVYYY